MREGLPVRTVVPLRTDDGDDDDDDDGDGGSRNEGDEDDEDCNDEDDAGVGDEDVLISAAVFSPSGCCFTLGCVSSIV